VPEPLLRAIIVPDTFVTRTIPINLDFAAAAASQTEAESLGSGIREVRLKPLF
jgi:hypothetical protein